MAGIDKNILDCNIKDEKQREKLISGLIKTYEQTSLCNRLKEAMALVKRYVHTRIPSESITKIRSQLDFMEKGSKDFASLVNKQVDEAKQKGSQAVEDLGNDLSCLKDTFGIDDLFMEEVFNLGQDFLQSNDFANAANIFTLLVLLDSFSAESYIALGLAEAGLGHEEAAEKAFGASLFLAPQDPMILYHVGRYYWNKGDKATAKGFFIVVLDSKESPKELKQYCQKFVA
jgi:tetratricopeptide (TPR) repeat protein